MKTILKLAFLILIPTLAQAQSGWNLVFSDEFNGNSLNTSVWGTTYPGGGQCTQQNEDEVYLPGALSEGAGNLTIFTVNNGSYADDGGGFICPGPWQSGLIQSNASNTTFTYGYFDAREKIPSGAGFWPAFWLYAATGTSGPEIDIMEMLNTATTTVYQTYHPTPSTQHQNVATSGTDCSANYCDFAVDWEPGVLRFYLNGTLTYTYSNGDVSSVAMYVLTNLAVGGAGSFPGSWNGTTPSPASMLVDYIRVYQHPVSGAGCYMSIPGPTPIPTTSCTPLPPPSTVHYSDYVTGNDANTGTSTGAPWKHAPGMMGLTPTGAATGDASSLNCASYTPQPGDLIILKGGSVWPSTTAPWTFGASGSSSSQLYGCAGSGCIYIGNAVGAGLPAWNSGTVTSITLKRDLGGWSPSSPPAVSCSGGSGSGAAATAHVVPAGNTDTNIAGFIYHISLTNSGSGYTSAPICTLTGGSGSATLVADINRPIFDLGGMQGSPPDWPIGQYSNFPNTYNPGLISTGNYVRLGGIEVRNMLTQQNTFGGLNDLIVSMVALGPHSSASNLYVHGAFLDCYNAGSCSGSGYEVDFPAIFVANPYDEAANNIIENGDAGFLGTSGQASNNICSTNAFCQTYEFGISTGTQSGYGPVSAHGNVAWMNSWQLRFVGNDATGSDPYLNYANEFWLVSYLVNPSAHINSRYEQLASSATMISYNNIVHSQVSGTSSQYQCPSGVTYDFYNEVQWGIGTGTQPYSADMADVGNTGGCAINLYNDTMYANNGGVCVNSQTGSNVTVITIQNLHCITTPTAANPFWSTGVTNSTYQNYAGSSVQANVQAASVVQSISTANGQGYTAANLFAPTSGGNATVTFSGANLTSLCSGYFTALCSDINGNPRSNAAFQGGAYTYGGATPACTSPAISPPSGPYVSPQTITMLTTGGCTIFYTTDNSTPNCSSTTYSGGFSQSIVTTTYIQAIACQMGYTTSGVAINNYTLNATPPPVTPNPLLFVCAGTHTTCCPALVPATTQYCLSIDGLFLSSKGAQYAQMLIPGPAGAPGAPGPAGPQGVAGKTGATGPAGASGVLSVNSVKPAANGNVTITPTVTVTSK